MSNGYLREKIDGIRAQLMESLTAQFRREIDRSLEHVRDAIAPYTRFVRADRERLDTLRSELHAVREGLTGIRAEVEALY